VTVLSVRGLHKAYGEIVVADGVGLELSAGECLGVIGPNGAGKSSLFDLLTGVVQPDAGSIRLAGTELIGMPAHRRARLGIARAFQVPQPFQHLTVYENLLAAATFGAGLSGHAAQNFALAQIERSGLTPHAARPAGSLTLLDRKRLELAKGMASAPRLLLLDEVAGGLTEREVAQVVELVRELKRSCALIWIEHLPHVLNHVADRMMVLHFGRKLLEDAPYAAMNSAVVREIYMGIPGHARAA
jgi:branched-chain amino acid transport system ATP-binding protein